MADYFALLSRAVASLDRNTKDGREALYDRARTALQGQLRAADPPWSDADIKAEAAALEAAIRQIEFEIRRSTARGVPPPPNRSPSKFAGAPRNRSSPPPLVVDPPPDGDAGEALPTSTWTASPAMIGAIGAVALALIAAGTYAYMSRSGTRTPVVAARTDSASSDSKPSVSQTPSTSQTPTVSQEPPKQKPASPPNSKAADAASSGLPYIYRRQLVFYRSTYPPGTIIIVKSQHTLYEVRPKTVALQYSIGIGSTCEDVAGMHRVVRKEMWPPWPPVSGAAAAQPAPASADQHRPESKLGARAIYLNDIDYGIHGTATPNTIGRDSSFGCFMLVDDDISDLYERANLDTRVVIMN